jgi:hemerythrin
MVEWKPSLNTGVEEIDAQHRTLFERAALLEAAVTAREPRLRLEELFSYLEDYALSHFAAEEQVMRESAYPGIAEHVREHSEFRRRLKSLVPHWESEGDSAALLVALLGFLEFWLTDHVTSSDQRLGAHLKSRGLVKAGLARDTE